MQGILFAMACSPTHSSCPWKCEQQSIYLLVAFTTRKLGLLLFSFDVSNTTVDCRMSSLIAIGNCTAFGIPGELHACSRTKRQD